MLQKQFKCLGKRIPKSIEGLDGTLSPQSMVVRGKNGSVSLYKARIFLFSCLATLLRVEE